MKNLQIRIITPEGLDSPQDLDYQHDDIFVARKVAQDYCQKHNYEGYQIIKCINNDGHYRTICWRDKNGIKIR